MSGVRSLTGWRASSARAAASTSAIARNPEHRGRHLDRLFARARPDPKLACTVTPPIECGQDATAQHLHAAQGAACLAQVALVVARLPRSRQKIVRRDTAVCRGLHGIPDV